MNHSIVSLSEDEARVSLGPNVNHYSGSVNHYGINPIIGERGASGNASHNNAPSISNNQAPGFNRYTRYDQDTRSIGSTPSKISKLTYSEYPQVRPTNPLYTSTGTIKTHVSTASSKGTTLNTVSRRQKYNPAAPRRIHDWRWMSALAILLFFPTGILAMGLAIKAKSKFRDGFIVEAKKLNKRSLWLCVLSIICGIAWLLALFFSVDKWPRTNG